MVAGKKSKRLRSKRKGLTFGQQEKAITLLPASARSEAERRISRQRGVIWSMVCSAEWFDAFWWHGQAYPPGGDRTAMLRCQECGRMTPPNSVNRHDYRTTRDASTEPLATIHICDDCDMGGETDIEREIYEAGIFERPSHSSVKTERR